MSADSPLPRRLPPSARDFFIYERIIIDLVSTPQAAQDAGVSQTRVRRIVRRVVDWLAESLPSETEASAAAYLRVAQHLAADRLERFYQTAARKWATTEQCKFASLALRVIQAQSKLPVLAGSIDALMADVLDESRSRPPGGTLNEPTNLTSPAPPSNATAQPETWNLKPETSLSPPPVRDCSAPAPISAASASSIAPSPAAQPDQTTTSDTLPSPTRVARAEFLSPAHPPLEPDDFSPITELKITPTSLGLTTHRPLTRKERRRHARSLATK